MPAQDTSELRNKILSILRIRGPLLPVHISNETGLSLLFASAFLSELLSDKQIKISHLKVGSSPVYFIPGQEIQLEKYSHHLKSKEKDAYLLLKEKKFLKDFEQEPAIRVALRSIRDFAIPFKKNDEIFWRYFTVPESEFQENKFKKSEEKKKEKDLDIFSKEPAKEIKKIEKKKITRKKTSSKKTSQKANENFFNKIKEHLAKNKIEILDIVNFSKDEAVLKIKKENSEEMLFAFNKKKISEKEILKAFKKSAESGLNYNILFLGEPTKKITDIIDAIKKLSYLGRID